jgi:hypothetical protein
MKNGQIAQLQELSKCHCLPRVDKAFVKIWSEPPFNEPLKGIYAAWLRRLWHQYRGQIAAMKRNRGKG